MRIRIKYFTDKIEKLDYIAGKSDWIDLRAAEEVELKKGEFALIPLGVAMELPRAEGVAKSRVSESIERGLRNMEKFLKNTF